MLQKGFSKILIIVIVLVVMGGGVLIWQWPENQSSELDEIESLIIEGETGDDGDLSEMTMEEIKVRLLHEIAEIGSLVGPIPSDWETFTSDTLKFSIQYPPGEKEAVGYVSGDLLGGVSEEELSAELNEYSFQKLGRNFSLSDVDTLEALKFGVLLAVLLPSKDENVPLPVHNEAFYVTIGWNESALSLEQSIDMTDEYNIYEFISKKQWTHNQMEGIELIRWNKLKEDWYPMNKGSLSYNLYIQNKNVPSIIYVLNFNLFPYKDLEKTLDLYRDYKRIINSFSYFN